MTLKETIELIQKTAIAAAGPKLVEEAADGRSATYVQEGQTFTIARRAANREHTVASLDDLIRFAKTRDITTPTVWYCHNCVVLLCDDSDRRDRVTLPLPWSKQFSSLLDMEAGEHCFEQRRFVRLLYRDLGVDAATVAKFRRLDFKVIQAAEGEFQHGSERLGKSVNAEIKGTAEIPEAITICVPVYDVTGERATRCIMCGVDLDAQRAQILFSPLPGEMSRAVEESQESIRQRLTAELSEDCIFNGRP